MRFSWHGRVAIRAFLGSLFVATGAFAAEVHPVESEIRRTFPAIALDSAATFDAADAFVGNTLASGLRPHFARSAARQHDPAMRLATAMPALQPDETTLRILYPRSYDGMIVAELGGQRVVLRAKEAAAAASTESSGKLVYTRPYASVDVMEVPRGGRSEELLLLHDEQAPLVFEYEIVATEGVIGVTLQEGAIRFLPNLAQVPATEETTGGRFTRPELSLQIDRPWVIDAWGKRTETQARWTLIGEGAIPTAVRLTVTPDRLAFPLLIDPSFSATGSLGTARSGHTATLLSSGKVLIAGGYNTTGGATYLASAELYDPATGTFSATGSLVNARYNHTATLLPNGKVLIAGGDNSFGYQASAELYDPATGTFSATGSLATARMTHTATRLPSGKVLIAGGANNSALATAELYDPSTGTFTATGSLVTARTASSATLLANGKVLIAAGYSFGGGGTFLSSAELYDPAAGTNGTFTATGNLGTGRTMPSATLLPNGKVLVAGGRGAGTIFFASAELYDPTGGTFTATGSMSTGRDSHTATLLPNGKVLIAGGETTSYAPVSSAELYDSTSGTFTATASLANARFSHTATLLTTGRVLMAGGAGASYLTSAELYDPLADTFSATGSLAAGRYEHTATLLANGKVLIVGGRNSTTYHASAELYDPASGTFSATGGMATARYEHTATLLPNGKVLIAGGYNSTNGFLSSAELYDPASGTFSATGSLPAAVGFHTATLLPSGKVLLAGGYSSAAYMVVAELYDPSSGAFSATGSLATARYDHTATLLPNGKVLISGGVNSTHVTSAEVYDPANGTFTATGNPVSAVDNATATLLPNGKVLIAGGYNGASFLNSAELYDPSNGTFTATGSLVTGRDGHAATLLPNGKVLIAGGYNAASYHLASAELYDPAAGTFSATVSLLAARASSTATLLSSGKVLHAAGYSNVAGYLTSAELYDVGALFQEAWRPVITSAPSTLTPPGTITLTGTGFRGISEASSGRTGGSPTNYPVVQLQRIDNEQTFFVSPNAAATDTAWSGLVSNVPAGLCRVTLFANGIPSVQKLVLVQPPLPLPVITPAAPLSRTAGSAATSSAIATVSDSQDAAGSLTVTATSVPAGLTVTGITNSGGTITASVAVACSATPGAKSVTLQVRNSASATATASLTVNVSANPAPTLGTYNDATLTAGQPAAITPSAAPADNGTVTVTAAASAGFAGALVANSTTGIVTIVNPNAGTYTVTVTATDNCGATASRTFTITVNGIFGAPAGFSATATSGTQAALIWSAVAQATYYEIKRSVNGGVLAPVGTTTATTWGDSGLTPNTTYVYEVCGHVGSFFGCTAPDVATTIVFTDDPVTSGVAAKAVHMTELRTAVNAMRAAGGLGPVTFTDSSLAAGTTTIKAAHITELRSALDAARIAIGLLPLGYTDPAIAAGSTTVKAVHVQEIRNGVK